MSVVSENLANTKEECYMLKDVFKKITKRLAVALCISAMCIGCGMFTAKAAESAEVEDGRAEVADVYRDILSYGTTKEYTFESSSDSVVYEFTVSKAGCVNFNIVTYGRNLVWLMYDENGDEVFTGRSRFYLDYNDSLGYGKNTIDADLMPGTYFLKIWVNESRSGQTFRLKATYTQAKVTETEPNNNGLHANSLQNGQTMYGQLAMNDDCDYYKIYVPGTTEIKFNFTSKKIIGVYLKLYDADGDLVKKTLLYSDSDDPLNKTVTYSVGKGTYYVCIDEYSSINGSFDTSKYYTGTYALKYVYGTAMSSKNVSISAAKCEYNGKTRNPSISAYTNGGKKLVNGKDYTVYVPAGRKNVGTYTYKVVFKGLYRGTVTKTFTILPARTKITAIANKSAGIKIAWKASSSTNATGYIVYRSVNGSAYKAIKIIRNNKTNTYGDTSANSWWDKYSYKVVTYKKVSGKTYKAVASNAKSAYRYY